MAVSIDLLSTGNPVFTTYVFYSAILIAKTLLMSLLTARQRFKNKVFASPEDVATLKGAKVKYDHPDVERVRRAHLNDLENIPIFFINAFFYVLTDPSPFLAINLIRAFAISRIIHTIVYAVVVIPQPARVLSWGVAYTVNWLIAVHNILAFCK